MADTKNDNGKPSMDRKPGADTGAGGKVSAGSSVGNIGQAPMPHAHDEKPAQSSTLASHTSKPMGGGQGADTDRSRGQASQQPSSQQSGQGSQNRSQDQGSMTDKAQQAADQVRQKAGEAYEGAAEWAEDTYERMTDWASDTYEHQRRRMDEMRRHSGRRVGTMSSGVQSYIAENPMVVGLVGLAAGLLLGALLPRTRRENEVFGEWADEVRNQGLRYAREAAARGREYVEENFSGDEAQFSRHESEFKPDRPDANRH